MRSVRRAEWSPGPYKCVCVSLHSRHVFLAKRRQKQSWHFFLQTHYSATFTNAADYWEEMIIISWGVPSGLRPVPGRRYDESFRDQLKITVLPMFGQLPNSKWNLYAVPALIRVRTTSTFQSCGLKSAFAFHCVNICFGNVEAILAKVQATTNRNSNVWKRLDQNHVMSLALQW